MLNKKSQVEDWLPLLLTMGFFIFLILIFSFLDINKDETTQKTVEFEIITKDSNKLLISYLRSPFTFNNIENSNIADAINYYFITEDKDLLKQIEAETDEFFSSALETDVSSWLLEIKYQRKDIKIESERVKEEGILSKTSIAEIIMPANKDKFVEIKLFFIGHEFIA